MPPEDRGREDEHGPEITDEEADDIRALLAATPGPGPLPDDVSARLDAALARAQAELDDDSTVTEGSHGSEAPAAHTVTALSTRRRTRRRGGPLLLAAASVAAALTIGGVALTSGLSDSDEDAAGAEAGSAAMDSRSSDAAAELAVAPQVLASGRDYTAEGLPSQVRALLDGAEPMSTMMAPDGTVREGVEPERGSDDGEPRSPDAAPARASVPPALARLREPEALTECVRELAAGDTTTALFTVDLASFAGEPAAVVVLERPGEERVEVWVVGGGCAAGDARVRQFVTVARG